MRGKPFLDASVLLYVLKANGARNGLATRVLHDGGQISVQVLNEFAAVARRKLKLPWEHIAQALETIRQLCPEPVPITISMHEKALRIAERYKYTMYDSLLIAAALQERCETMFTEDMQDGQRIEHLTLRNPFRLN